MAKGTLSLADRLLEFMGGARYRPLKQHELANALGVRERDRARLRAVLRDLERRGKIACLRKNRWGLPDQSRDIRGRLSVHNQGFGIVQPEIKSLPEVFIPRNGLGTGLHGDTVLVTITRSAPSAKSQQNGWPGRPARAQGRVARVVERRLTSLVGLLRRSRYYWYVIPDNPRVLHDVHIRDADIHDPKLKEFHKVVVALDPWERETAPLKGVIIEDLGPRDARRVDVVSVMRDHGLDPDFPEDLVRQAARTSPTPSATDLAGRRDLRKVLTVTIDPDDAKDFDDAISLERSGAGHWIVGVHIADVAHFIPQGSALDEEAFLRGNSVYMVDGFVPMLPQRLTREICSLQPNQDRLTHSVTLHVDDHGRVLRAETYPSVIRSNARYTYDQVQDLFDGKAGHGIPEQHHALLRDMDRLAILLRKKRMAHGAIDLAMPEITCELDAEGKPINLHRRGAHEAYHVVEEFMLLANCAVAERLSVGERPAIYRIHEAPSEAQWASMRMDLQALGVDIEPQSREDISAICRRIRGTPIEYAGNLAILRNLKRALYSSSREEHFGLAFDCYTHFTSPIRRYPDLVVHRLLRAIEQNRPPPYSHAEVARIAEHCSETERNADEAEEESLTIKRIQFYSERLRKGEIGPHQALVAGIVSRGMLIELLDTLQRGLVHFSTMTDDHYRADPVRGRAIGQRHRKTYTLGQVVSVELINVDEARRLVDFRLAVGPTQRERHRGKKRRDGGHHRMR